MSRLYLCGAGNPEGVRLALNVNRHEAKWSNIAILDDDPAKRGRTILGVTIEGPMTLLESATEGDAIVNLVARTTERRAAVARKLSCYRAAFTSLIDPTVDTFGAEIGHAVTVYRNATVSACAKLGDHVVIFAGANAGHGSTIGEGAILAPGAVVNARVKVGARAYVGANASVLPDLEIGEGATIGSVSSVIENVPAGATAMGVPAEILIADSAKAPTTAWTDPNLERVIFEIWADVLGADDFGPDASFFDVGGDSVRAMQMRERVAAATQRNLSPVAVFRYPTVRALAAYLSERPSSTAARRRAARARLAS